MIYSDKHDNVIAKPGVDLTQSVRRGSAVTGIGSSYLSWYFLARYRNWRKVMPSRSAAFT